jgi:hypothetical protein
MRNLFNIGKEMLSIKRDSKERKKIRKREKAPQKLRVFLRPAHELSLNWDDVTKRDFHLKTRFPSLVHRIQLPTLEAGGSYFNSSRKFWMENCKEKK